MTYLDSREYNWMGFKEVPTVRGKVSRALAQFTPYSWTPFNWHAFSDFKRFCSVMVMVVMTLLIELDAFFLKDILWVPPRSPLNVRASASPPAEAACRMPLPGQSTHFRSPPPRRRRPQVYRLLIWWAVGMVALRDYYAFITDSSVKRLGATCWVSLAMALMELIVVIKFGAELYKGQSMPPAIIGAWALAFAAGAAALAYWFLVALPKAQSASHAAPVATNGRAKAAAATPAAAPSAIEDANGEAEELEEEEQEQTGSRRGRRAPAAEARKPAARGRSASAPRDAPTARRRGARA
jgi:phosphatidylserine synthase 2